ncbi:hypothetical protein ACQKP3_19960 [Vibrio sp. DNB22_10_4]
MLKRRVEDFLFGTYSLLQRSKLPRVNGEINLIATGDSVNDYIESLSQVNVGCNWLLKKYGDRIQCQYYLLSDPSFFNDENIDYVLKVIEKVDLLFIPFQSFIKRRELWPHRSKLYLLNFNSTYVNVEEEFTYSLGSRIHCANTVVLEFGIPVTYALTDSFINVYGFDLKYNKELDVASEDWRSRWTKDVLTSFSLIPKEVLKQFRFKGIFKPSDLK